MPRRKASSDVTPSPKKRTRACTKTSSSTNIKGLDDSSFDETQALVDKYRRKVSSDVTPSPKKRTRACTKTSSTTDIIDLDDSLFDEDQALVDKYESDPDYDSPPKKKKKANTKKSNLQNESPPKKKKKVIGSIKSEPLDSADIKLKCEPTKLTGKKKNIGIKDEMSADCQLLKSENKKMNIQTVSEIDDHMLQPLWRDYELLAEEKCIPPNIAKNVIKLLEDGNTIPFIARYRRDATGNMTPEVLQEVKSTFEDICALGQKIKTSVKEMMKQGYCQEKVLKAIKSSRSLEELEITYAPYKPDRKGTLADRAKELGLEEPALTLLYNTGMVNLQRYVTANHDIKEIETGIIHIIAYNIAVDSEMLTYIRQLRCKEHIVLESKRSKTKTIANKSGDKKGQKPPAKNADESKFETYFDYQIPVKYAKPHQVLAMNRGEKLKFLTVKVVIPDSLFSKFQQFCYTKWIKLGPYNVFRINLLNEAVKDSYNRLVKPLITREIRSELKNKADKASYDVFSKNLKHLLKEPPLKGQVILGIDPGFAGGCKMAVISQTGSVLNYNVIHPFGNRETAANVLNDMLQEHSCSLIALGNGKACRETEEFICDMIKQNYFYPLDVKYVIVSEDGASVYSCSPEAKKEFPKLDTNIISAVSLARRLQDPLAELVKIEPHHLGIGMYQHDLKKKSIEEALEEVVSECVSFIGVDLNTASSSLLRRVAGLTDKRVRSILKYREENGPFYNREQLNKVTGIGAKVFKQCAGFLRVGPTDAKTADSFYKKSKTTKLDCTYVHPESYDIASKLIKKLKLQPIDIGQDDFIQTIKSCENKIQDLSGELNCSLETMKLIVEALSKPLNYDLRTEIPQRQIFRREIANINDLTVDTEITGRVSNVTHFGCFVDIGVGKMGLIHVSKMNGLHLQVGDKVEVRVLDVDIARGRISLQALSLMMNGID